MAQVLLRDIIEDSRFEDLPPTWNSFDLESFSKSKKLWDYQQRAAENAIKVLWRYYQDFVDYQRGEGLEKTQERKHRFFQCYRDNGLELDLSINLDKRKRNIYNLLTAYYPQDNGRIDYEHLINRMCFWMATGSGKTLVIIKLIQVLKALMERGEIPPYDILILTYRDDLIQQLKRHVSDFNYANNEIHIRLTELKEYPEVKRQQTLFGKEEITVFYYRSDNLNDEQKEKIVDFRNYDNDGKWYIFLDEAHKGDKTESKRQHIYSILSRNGFLFNSSATFIDQKDIVTCAYEFNLSSFIRAGYGKHIAILKQETKAFRDDEPYSDEEKQKIVLKSLILLTYAKQFYEEITKIHQELYHNPLLLTLVNSVNTEDADLKLFFRELERIGKGDVEQELFNSALDELWEELKLEPEFMFEDGDKVRIDEASFKSITTESVLRHIYNSATTGEIEILVRPSSRKELAFKLKTSDKPFALIKIGDVSSWLKNEFAGYEVNERFEDESYFESLNREDSTINILMGSRSFYEGWDSNRPNVINYINIGIGEDARKFILQSVGRGVRIEPIKDKRKRLLHLYNAKEISGSLFNEVKANALPLETLFIFGTNRDALQTVIQELQDEKKRGGEAQQLSLFVNREVQKHKLLVPTYKQAEQPIFKDRERTKFEIAEADFELLNKLIEFIPDDRVFLMRYNTEPLKTRLLRDSLSDRSNFGFAERSFRNVDLLAQRIFEYFSLITKKFKELKELKDEIKHFKNIKVTLEDISEIQGKVEKVKGYPEKKQQLEKELHNLHPEVRQQIQDMLIKEATETYEYEHKKIKIKYIANHYYIPLILSENEKVDYIKHVIRTRSEVKFVNDLESYLTKSDSKFKDFDWWLFSKLDENLDDVYIPYYNPNVNKISNFYPDFIFWLKKGNGYFIVFVDPKGTEHPEWADKVNGYKKIFEEGGKAKVITSNGFRAKVELLLRATDATATKRRFPEHSQYWFDDIGKMLEQVTLE